MGAYFISREWGFNGKNLLMSEDVIASVNAIRKLGVKQKLVIQVVKFMVLVLMDINTKKSLYKCTKFWNTWKITGRSINKFSISIKIIGDESLSKRDFKELQNP